MSASSDRGETPLVEMRNLHKFYERVHALNDVNFKIYPGEAVGLIGENGAGKSTLIKILAGVIRNDKGEIFWKGERVEIPSVDVSRRLGIETVFQEATLIDIFNVGQNIFLGREPTKRLGPIRHVDYRRMNETSAVLLKELRLRVTPDREVRFCSGGERQGIAVSRAMHFKANLVILDEPTRGLSIMGVEQIWKFARKLKEEKIACIFITHQFHDVYPVADRFVMLARGIKVLDKEKKDLSIQDLEAEMLRAYEKAEQLASKSGQR